MLEIKNLTVTTKDGIKILDNISFYLRSGEITALTGPSGSGKTTIVKTIMGILDKKLTIEGEIYLDKKSIFDMSKKGKRKLCGSYLGYIPQNPLTSFTEFYKIEDLMGETIKTHMNIKGDELKSLIVTVLNEVNLWDTDRILNSYPKQLSGGMLQRISMALILSLRPKYIFCDEASSALDKDNTEILLNILEKMKKDSSILFISHDIQSISSLCDRVFVIDRGKIIENKPKESFFKNPQSAWSQIIVSFITDNKQKKCEWKMTYDRT